jgi:two-component system, cell cycle sensor histidine kinase PleC
VPNPVTLPSPKAALAALRARNGVAGWVVANLIVAALYFGLGWLVSKFFTAYGLFPAPIWLPMALAMVAAIAGGWRVFPGIFLGSFAANDVLFAAPLAITTIISVTNALGPVLGAAALAWRPPAKGLFTSFGGAIWFLVCTTMLSPAVSATGGAIAMSIGPGFDGMAFYSTWVGWWLCDGSGTLYLAPALLLWLGLETGAEGDAGAQLRFVRQHLWIWATIAAVSIVLFLSPPLNGSYIHQALPFLLVVPLSWVALRMPLRWAYTLISLVAFAAVVGTVAGYGPFQDRSLANPLQMVGILVVVLAMNVLTIAALVSELHQARRDNLVKSMFLANTSHELRTPLNAIIGFSSMIDDETLGPLNNAKYAEYAHIIHTAGEQLLSLINGLLDLSKIEAGRMTLSEENLSLRELLEDAAALVGPQATGKSVTVAKRVEPETLGVFADEKALRQILLNLANNAVKFTPSGGRVDLSAALGERGEVVIRVSDTGIGIPAGLIGRLFVPFERLHRHTAPEIEGTGLGLAITRGLVTLHGGAIGVVSAVGEGTRVTVTLPSERVVILEPLFAEAAD